MTRRRVIWRVGAAFRYRNGKAYTLGGTEFGYLFGRSVDNVRSRARMQTQWTQPIQGERTNKNAYNVYVDARRDAERSANRLGCDAVSNCYPSRWRFLVSVFHADAFEPANRRHDRIVTPFPANVPNELARYTTRGNNR